MMSDRKLRSGTRKDYSKMVEESPEKHDSEDDHDGATDDACVKNQNNNNDEKQQHADESSGDDSKSIPEESDREYEYESVFESDEDDAELKEAELKLQLMKKQQKLLLQKTKRARIARKTEEVEKSLKELKKNARPRKKKVTAASLRNMDDVVAEVDRLMDENLNLRKKTTHSSASEAESDILSVRSSRSSGSGARRKQVEEKSGKERHGEKKISGKSKSSLNSQIKFPQKWPHSYLNPSFVNSKEKAYEDLSISEFVAGYMTILEDDDSEERRTHRSEHLKELMYLSTRFKWKNILDYHGACLTEIERGHLKWGSSFQLLQSTTLSGGLLTQNSRWGSGGHSDVANRSSRNDDVIFCKGYQRGSCQQPKDHFGLFYGQNRFMKHICGNCWQKLRTQSPHPETSDECPLKEKL